MPRSVSNKTYRTFVAGMITEASPLTYPENASTREDNCVIFQKGNRTRRLGFEQEPEGVSSSFFIPTNRDVDINEFSWEAVDETGETDILVQRAGNFIYFYRVIENESVSPQAFDFIIDLRSHQVAESTILMESSEVEFTSGRGFLFVVGQEIEPFSVEFNNDTNQFTTRVINIRVRDFVGVDDGLANDFEPPTLSNEHHYNLRNQGWVAPSSKEGNTTTTGIGTAASTDYSPGIFRLVAGSFSNQVQSVDSVSSPITRYFNQIGLYPGNNKAWWVGKLEIDNPDKGLSAGDFDPDILCETYVGNTLAARGHFILDAFNKDRSSIGGVPGLETKVSRTRPNTTSFYAGKVWFAHESDLYYSQTLIDHRQAGNCFQEADPTSETISDLIATDGGQIPIPEAYNIRRIHPVGGSLVVFAENGVWSVQGGNGGFSATDISVTKVSSNGILGTRTLVEANGVVYWWSHAGIMSLAQRSGVFGAQEGVFDRENISETTIQSFYQNNIPESAKAHARGVFDPIRNMVQWLFKSDDSSTTPNKFFNRILNLDVTLQAFYPWTLQDNQGRSIVGVVERTAVNRIQTPGIETQEGSDTFNSYVRFVYAEQDTLSTARLSYGDFQSQTYADFGDQPYESFMETGHEILEDLMRRKQSNYVFLYFRRTDDEDLGIGSDCFFQTRWDWSRNYNSNRWSRKVQGYRITDRYSDASVVSTKHKARGQGRAIQLRFESSEIGKTFDLLGWATNYTGITTV